MDQSRTLIHNQVQEVSRNEGKPPKVSIHTSRVSVSKVLNDLQAIVLVGGFGKCEYVYNTLRSMYEKRGIEILRPRGEFSDA